MSFRQLLLRASEWLGSPWAVTMAALAIMGWGLLGHRFRYSDRWQLAIDTMTSIVTFLMVFLIQYSQNRDVKAIQLKLDEIDSRGRWRADVSGSVRRIVG